MWSPNSNDTQINIKDEDVFDQIIYYLVVIFMAQSATTSISHEVSPYDLYILFLSVVISIIVIFMLSLIAGRILLRKDELSRGLLEYRFQKLLHFIAIILIGIIVYPVHFKNIIVSFTDSELVFPSTLPVLILFWVYQIIIWRWASSPSFIDELTGSWKEKWKMPFYHWRQYVPILLPWFIIIALHDLLIYLAIPGITEFLFSWKGGVLLFLIFIILVLLFLPALLIRAWRAKPFSDMELRRKIEIFCVSMGFRPKDILLWPLLGGRGLSAGVIGILPGFRYLLFTPALLDVLNKDEILAVTAHEIGHVRHRHLLLYLTFFLIFFFLIKTMIDIWPYIILKMPFIPSLIESRAFTDSYFLPLLVSLPIIIIFVVYFRYLFGYFIRNFEREADLFSLKVIGNPYPIIGALEKIAIHSGQPRNLPSWHHFSIEERINFLKMASQESSILQGFQKKIKKRLFSFYLLFTILIGGAWYYHRDLSWNEAINNYIQKELSEKVVKGNPDISALLDLALLYHQEGRCEEAADLYKMVIERDPKNVTALNNLAWLYVTGDDERLKNPSLALRYAIRAAKIDPTPVVLDTLAVSYFANGMIKEAIEAIKLAIRQNPPHIKYYRSQLKRFEKFIKKGNT